MVRSFLNALRVEFGICLRSGWTLAMLLLLLAWVVFSVWNSYNVVMSQVVPLNQLQDYFGSDFQNWLASSSDAENFRNAILAANPANSANLVLSSCGVVGVAIFVVWSAFVVGNDFFRRTANTRAAHLGWVKVIWSKLIVIAATAIVVIFIALVVGILFSHVLWHYILQDFSFASILTPDTPQNIFAGYLAIVLGFWFFGSFAIVVTLLVKNLPLGIIISLVIPFVDLNLNQWWLPMRAFLNLQTGIFTYSLSSSTTLPPATGPVSGSYVWAILVVWLLAAVAASHLIARNQSV